MRKKIMQVFIFVASVFCFIIHAVTFFNMATYSDEYNTTPANVLGGDIWLFLNWFTLFVLFAMCIASFYNMTKQ